MPYKNEHSCRLISPDKFDKFNRKNCEQKHEGKCIDVIYGIKNKKSKVQSLRYKTNIWTKKDAKAHCKSREGTFEPAKEEKAAASGPERRFLPIGEMRVSEGDNGELIIEGRPIVYEKYANLWGFKEIIREGAATEALKKKNEYVLWNHSSSMPMAGRKNGTLEAKEDKEGVTIRADVCKTVWGREGYEAIEADLVDQMSFAFDVARNGDHWFIEKIDGVEFEVREILQLEVIYDYSPVTYPAYEDTEVIARNKTLAMRNKPSPGAPEQGSAAALEVLGDARDNIERIRRSIDHGH